MILLDKDTPLEVIDRVLTLDSKPSKPVIKAFSAELELVPLYVKLQGVKVYTVNNCSIVFEIESDDTLAFVVGLEKTVQSKLCKAGKPVQNRLVDSLCLPSSFNSCINTRRVTVFATEEQTRDLTIVTDLEAIYLGNGQVYSTIDMRFGFTFHLTHLQCAA